MLRTVVQMAALQAIVVLALCVPSEAKTPPSEQLLPNTTEGWLSVGDVDKLRENWLKTQLGQLANDPVMKPFTEDFSKQLKSKWLESHARLGLSWDDLEGVYGGEVAVAMVQPNATKAGLVVLVDVTGHQAEAKALLEKITANLTKEGATRARADVEGVRIFNMPREQGEKKTRQAICFLRGDLFGAAEDLEVAEGILARLSGEHKDTLASVEAFTATMNRCQTGAEGLTPHLRWFIDPFGYAEAARIASPPREKRKTDLLKILKTQGFTAIQGGGGFLNFYAELPHGKYEMLHRNFVYAPPIPGSEDRYKLAARMLKFPNGGDFTPQGWVPRDIATYASFNLDIQNAFEASSTLVDALAGPTAENVLEDVIDSIKTDPNGPQVDIRKDLIGNLGHRVTVVTDYQLPITPKSERVVVAAETKDEEALATAINKTMESDPTARKLEFEGLTIWEIVNEETPMPKLEIEGPDLGPRRGGADKEAKKDKEEERAVLPNSAVAVAYGHMYIATHVDFLKKILHHGKQADGGESLAQAVDYRMVDRELEKLGAGENCVRFFSRTDEEYRPTYELIKMGKMPESETMLGKALNRLFGEGKEGVLREQRIDGHSLPDYDVVRRYLGPAGMYGTSEDDGWYLVGCTLSKEPSVAAAER